MPLTFHLELAHHPKRVCGVDEAGRGPLAGPVVAGAVMFHSFPKLSRFKWLKGLNDSKLVPLATRETLYVALHEYREHVAVGFGIASVEEIDTHNIWGATVIAMRRAAEHLHANCGLLPDVALVDGKAAPKNFPHPTQMVIGGDAISPSIAAASIIAKVTRDRMMRELAQRYPHYGFERHAGYGTKQHQQALAEHGVCPAHRRSFAPIRAMVEAEVAA